MALADPQVERAEPLTETETQKQRGGWSLRPRPRIGLDLGSDDELLILENRTVIPWVVYHNFHQIGIIDPHELLLVHLCKHGTLNARPSAKDDTVEYLVITLNQHINQVYIYQRALAPHITVYDMRAA